MLSWPGVLVDHRFKTTCFGHVTCCSLEDRVVGVVLPNWKIKGCFQEDAGVGLDQVHTISLQANIIDGRLPPSFGFLKSLTALDLANNALTGPIPPEFGELRDLTMLQLQGNTMTGNLDHQVARSRPLDVCL